MSILAAIITYNPEYDVLLFNLDKLYHQVDHVLIVNNSLPLKKESLNHDKLTIIENNKNIGIASALNVALTFAFDQGYTYFLSMDQDSILSDGYVEKLMSFFNDPQIAIVGPNIVEKELGRQKANNVSMTQEVSHVITSGSINLVKVLKEVGGFEDKLFIDMVDLDICYKVHEHGFKILQTNELELDHRIGEPHIKKGILKTHFIRNHAPFRKYFFIRNRLYIAFRYRKRGLKFVFGHLIGIIYYCYIVLFYEKNKIKKMNMILRGFFDFLRGDYSNRMMK